MREKHAHVPQRFELAPLVVVRPRRRFEQRDTRPQLLVDLTQDRFPSHAGLGIAGNFESSVHRRPQTHRQTVQPFGTR